MQKKLLYPGYQPESLEVSRTKYELDVAFPPTDEYLNEDNVSAWSLYEDRVREVRHLKDKLKKINKL